MRKARKLFSYIRIVLEAGPTILFYHLTKMHKYAKHPEKYPLDIRYKNARTVLRRIIKAYRVDIHCSGLENLSNVDGKVMFVSNHLSTADPVALVSLLDKPITFAAKQETLDMPFVGAVLLALDGVPLDRGNIMNQLSQIKLLVNTIKSEKYANVCIFAEGTRNKEPKNPCLEFHAGSIKMAYMANTPIIPITLYGTWRIFSAKHFLRKYPVYVNFGKPIYPSEYKNISSVELSDKLRHQIDQNVNRFRLLDKKEICAQRLTKKRKLYEIEPDNIKLSS